MFHPLFKQFIFTSVWAMIPIGVWALIVGQIFPDTQPSLLEIIATWLTLVCVWLTTKQNMWSWPIGIISVALFAWVSYEYQLYSSALLNSLYYIPVQVFGWYVWANGRQVNWSQTWIERGSILGAITLCTFLWAMFCTTYTDARFVAADSVVLGMSVVAQWLLSYKRPEAWLIYVIVDVISTWLYFSTDLVFFGALYFGFIFVALYGCWQWVKSIKANTIYMDMEVSSFTPGVTINEIGVSFEDDRNV